MSESARSVVGMYCKVHDRVHTFQRDEDGWFKAVGYACLCGPAYVGVVTAPAFVEQQAEIRRQRANVARAERVLEMERAVLSDAIAERDRELAIAERADYESVKVHRESSP